MAGLKAGDRFVGPDGRAGVINQVRHKYVARLQFVMQHHEERFPETFGSRSVSVDVDRPEGLDNVIAEVKARHEWISDEENQYLNGPMPLGVFAHRVGMDTIEVSTGIAAHGGKLKVAVGNLDERDDASRLVRLNDRRGCVLDLLAFWTTWRLKALDALKATCGPVHLPQSVLDRLRSRREQFNFSARDGHKSIGYRDGKLALTEMSAESVEALRDDIGAAISWAEAEAIISPIIANEDLPEELREHLRHGRSDIFDALLLARQSGLLLVSDDLPTREFDRLWGGKGGAWLHVVFCVAFERRHIDFDQFIRWSANLVDAGHSYLGVSGTALAQAARLDAAEGNVPGYLFRTLTQIIGGAAAEPISHVQAAVGCIRELWSDNRTHGFREAATGHLLRQLIRDRRGDYAIILRSVLAWSRGPFGLIEYIDGWLRGHFIRRAVQGSAAGSRRS